MMVMTTLLCLWLYNTHMEWLTKPSNWTGLSSLATPDVQPYNTWAPSHSWGDVDEVVHITPVGGRR